MDKKNKVEELIPSDLQSYYKATVIETLCIRINTDTDKCSSTEPGPLSPAAPPTLHPPLARCTVKVDALPGPVPGGQAALQEAHLLGPAHLPGLQQALVRQRVLQGTQERGQLPVRATGRRQLWGAEEMLEGHLGGGRTARGGIVLAGEGSV